MKQILILSSLLCLTLAFGLSETNAQVKTQAKASPVSNATTIKKVEQYFQSLSTAEANFVQTANDGTQSTGKFYLSRPNRLRFQYDAPLTDFIVADGTFIYFYDGQLKQQSNAPISQTLADFILRKNLKLSGDLRVNKIAKGGGLLQVTIVQTSDPLSGSLTLGFSETPKFELKKWQIRDASGAVTEIELSNLKQGMKFKSGLFNYIDPKPRKLN
jgi:outer membrane lipoprotein-sorting protein